MNNLRVQKKDGRVEGFDIDKIKKGIMASGATEVQVQNVAAEIESWASTHSINGIVRTPDVRAKLIEILGGVNPKAKANFESFKKN